MEDQPIYGADEAHALPDKRAARFNGFLPLTLLAVSWIIVLVWQLGLTGQAKGNARTLRDQQTKLVEQSKAVQAGLERLARDLVEVAKTDDDAKAIVAKYNINITPPESPPAK